MPGDPEEKEFCETIAAYDAIADIYAECFAARYIARYSNFLLRNFLEVLPGRQILDIACGTGDLASTFAHQGSYAVTACDVSQEMVRKARKHANHISLLVCDMRRLPFKGAFDGVSCTFDSINHLLNDADFNLALHDVALALRPKGVFIFDANLPEGFAARWKGEQVLETETETWTMRPQYNAESRAGRFGLTAGRNEVEGRHLNIHQRAISNEFIVDGLVRSGFADVCSWDAGTIVPKDKGRRFYRAFKRS